MKAKPAPSAEPLKQITHLATALKAPRITESAARLADHARDAGWTHEDYLAAVLEREVAAKLTWPPPSASPRAGKDTGSCSPPPPTGSPA